MEHCRADVRIMRHCNLFTHPARAGQRPVSPDGGAYIILELPTRLRNMSQCLKKPFSGAVSLLNAPMLNLLLNICISKIGTVVQNCQFTKKAQLASCLKRFLSVQALVGTFDFQQSIENCEKSRCQLYIIRVTGAVIPLALALCILFNFGTAFGRQLQDD